VKALTLAALIVPACRAKALPPPLPQVAPSCKM
jgi:hypothetical protein